MFALLFISFTESFFQSICCHTWGEMTSFPIMDFSDGSGSRPWQKNVPKWFNLAVGPTASDTRTQECGTDTQLRWWLFLWKTWVKVSAIPPVWRYLSFSSVSLWLWGEEKQSSASLLVPRSRFATLSGCVCVCALATGAHFQDQAPIIPSDCLLSPLQRWSATCEPHAAEPVKRVQRWRSVLAPEWRVGCLKLLQAASLGWMSSAWPGSLPHHCYSSSSRPRWKACFSLGDPCDTFQCMFFWFVLFCFGTFGSEEEILLNNEPTIVSENSLVRSVILLLFTGSGVTFGDKLAGINRVKRSRYLRHPHNPYLCPLKPLKRGPGAPGAFWQSRDKQQNGVDLKTHNRGGKKEA